ncbi:hypothetical protein BGW39_011583 [Mortierella sp. 14UC]|nr:hypothetical protein BGW39_011583 [Mortierella sp. 14UC]
MWYHCPNHNCDHRSMLRCNPPQHQKNCQYRDRTVIEQPKRHRAGRKKQPLPLQPQPSKRQQRSVIRPLSYRERSPADLAVSRTLPPASTLNGIPPVPTAAIAATHDQLLESVGHLADRLTKLGKQLDKQSEQMDWLIGQVETIQSQNASLKERTGSLRTNMNLMEPSLGDSRRKSVEQLSGVLANKQQLLGGIYNGIVVAGRAEETVDGQEQRAVIELD